MLLDLVLSYSFPSRQEFELMEELSFHAKS